MGGLLRVLVAVVLLHQKWGIDAACYFPQEFLGEYIMQSTVNAGSTIQYSTLNITTNSIPIWGNCHTRIDNNFILMFNYGENSCIRCLRLKLRSKNVLQVLASSQETISKCFINEESAKESCPNESAIKNKSTAETILFKKRDVEGGYTSKEYCPFDRKYSVAYKINDGSNKHDCMFMGGASMDTCPSGSTLNLRFPRCSLDYELDCLGHWEGPNQQKYLALLDKRLSTDKKPQYRCALYKRHDSGVVHMALSKDSTCISELYNATHGYETMVLTPLPESEWPVEVLYSSCRFPDWMQGEWEHLRVKGDTIVYKNHVTFKTYTIKCVGNLQTEEKFLVFSRSQCNEEQYNCLRVMRRSSNILEFQLGTNSSRKSMFDVLCTESNFDSSTWTTQGRLENMSHRSAICPISGEYTGMIPDSPDLCAKLWSDCRAPELMYYQVSDCATSEIYEERQYMCLGHWSEADLLYTYTQRYDVAGTYECFVGANVSDSEIYIKEAGEHCQRHMDPIRYGMKLSKQGQGLYSCLGHDSSYDTSSKAVSSTTASSPRKPWIFGMSSKPTESTEIEDNRINTAPSASSVFFVHIFTMVVIRYL